MDKGLILILTGGLSQRMGRPKALLPLSEGAEETFFERLERITSGLPARRIVVSSLPVGDLGTDLPVVRQIAPEKGQLDSLLLGWAASDEEAPWVMSCPVDHPYVKRSTLEALIQATRDYPDAQMWSPEYQGRGGHPVIFASSLIPELRKHVSEGARPVVQGLGEKRCRLRVDDAGVLSDVDTPEDYREFSSLYLSSLV